MNKHSNHHVHQCHHYMLTVICKLPISPLRPDEQTSVAEYSLHRCWRAECSEDPLKQWFQTDKVLVVHDKAPVQGLPISMLSAISCRDFQSSTTTKKAWNCSRLFQFFVKTKTKTYVFVLDTPRDQDLGLEDYITAWSLLFQWNC